MKNQTKRPYRNIKLKLIKLKQTLLKLIYFLSTLFTVKYGTHNKTTIENINIILTTIITTHTKKRQG